MIRRDYLGEIDECAVYCHDLGTVYLVPIDHAANKRQAALRVDPPRNNQHHRVRLAAYETARFEVI